MASTGFPGLQQLGETRYHLWQLSHDWRGGTHSTSEKVGGWLGHKALSVISLPADAAGAVLGTAGLVASASTLGALKVATYAVTGGNVKLDFPTGCAYFAEGAAHAAVDGLTNVGEIIYDAANTAYQGYRLVRWTGKKLHLEKLTEAMLRQVRRAAEFAGERLGKGLDIASNDEADFRLKGETPYPIALIDSPTKAYRIDSNAEDRQLSDIAKHTLLSAVNVPVNTVAAICAGTTAIVLSSAFVGKTVLYATTGIHIPVPTYAGQAIDVTFTTTKNAVTDVAHTIGDGFVTMYKVSDAVGLNKVIATARDVLRYIPEAIFGK